MTVNFVSSTARSSNRISLRIPISIHGLCKDKTEFHEDTSTLLVNAGGALVPLVSKVSLGEPVRLINKSTMREEECRVAYIRDLRGVLQAGIAFRSPLPNFWRVSRRENRVAAKVRVTVRGVDPNGETFVQSAEAIDISRHGARLDGVGYVARPGQVIEVKRLWHTARFRVLWVGHEGTPEAGQAGAFALDPKKNLWGAKLS